MNYQKYFDVDVVNGPGTRCTLFVSGCAHGCKGCYNQSTWSPNSGHPFTDELADRIIADLSDTRIRRRGLSLSGGDPLFPGNCESVLALCQRVKAECPGKDIWLWTGYLAENLTEPQRAIVDLVDVLIDGPFVQDLADRNLAHRGSSNQRIIHTSDTDIPVCHSGVSPIRVASHT
ncbi:MULTISPECIES: anaerobic ribonucleoside-triphosphate reductase-activating protein [unclassified Lentimonas]|uniref:anaerobic ribonucleoside-triphosphate reductase-activating protein n=1 Tax=unclassified Lentimonas TaxID=2630993 RepID=UPI00132A3A43|nr:MULTISPECIES: anaerobic ribonucleoside-triphosphate reductase-activating protein [unclassified Lentimonas]CAA6677339.1 Ribonucleotide reductase of class III (anaerobic), activating protein (EC [Lentimonas sp. CC4]CAA6686884.1 Ribonucleotide reductase of class III (anaerobic), activating protein (EC [Lentimonas sp. CC6]CAA7074585.1 Ribonucleotide reductase of class III (anaerobic), activating protein (EC [Lentimonas sp. CC4]CAA7169201.1 Ribonucleotide reductase of class III (anaerobic), activ